MPRFLSRRDKLRRTVRRTSADALLVTNFTNVTYLTGFTGDDSYLLVGAKDDLLISDSRYTEQIEGECPGLNFYERPLAESMLQAVARAVRVLKVGVLGVESSSMTVELYEYLGAGLPKTTLASTVGLVEALREIKDKEEVAELREAVRLAEKAFEVVRASLRPEQTEREIAANIEHYIRQFGGEGCSFPPIVAVGSRAALPHAHPTERQIGESGFVLIDWGAQAKLYRSDLTRVLMTDKISSKVRDIYRVVLKANRAGIDAVGPGVLMSEVDAVARRVIEKAGYGKQFGHGLGHGIGIDIHEAPRLNSTSKRPLKAGMVVTVEPGIYLPGIGGVRIEDDVLVTRSGKNVLTTCPKEFDACCVD